MVAEGFLARRVVILAGSVILLSSCGNSLTGYQTKEPEEIGSLVDRLRQEVAAGLVVQPSESRRTFWDSCGEDWREPKTVQPNNGDPWQVKSNQFNFKADFTILVESQSEARPIYSSLFAHLQRVGGWKMKKEYMTSGLLGGISGQSKGILLSAHDYPQAGGSEVNISLQSSCYKLPKS
jgi:hypothetical protein